MFRRALTTLKTNKAYFSQIKLSNFATCDPKQINGSNKAILQNFGNII